jgi:hypothetical protein
MDWLRLIESPRRLGFGVGIKDIKDFKDFKDNRDRDGSEVCCP